MTFSLLSERWMTEMAAVTWQFAVLAIVTWLVLLVLGKKVSPRARHLVWFFVLLRLLIPVGFNSPFGLVGQSPEVSNVSAAVAEVSVETSAKDQIGFVSTPAGTSRSVLTSPIIVLGVWATLAGLLIAAWGLRTARSHARLRRSWSRAPASMQHEVDGIAQTLGFKNRIAAMVVSDALVTGPGVLGLLRPRLILPENSVSSLQADEQKAVIVHELLHIKRRDHLLQPFTALLQALYFFHPVVWLVVSWLRREREIAVDDQVISTLGQETRCEYAEALLRFARTRATATVPSVGMGAPRSQVGRRLFRFFADDYQSNRRSRKTALAVLTSCVLATLAFAAGTLPSDNREGPDVHWRTAWEEAQVLRDGHPTWVEITGDFELGYAITENIHFRSRLKTLSDEKVATLSGEGAIIAATVDVNGRPGEIVVVKPVQPEVDEILMEAVRESLFEPTRHYKDGAVPVRIRIRFQLAGRSPAAQSSDNPQPMPGEVGPDLIAAYTLNPGEALRLLLPPHGPERLELYRLAAAHQAAGTPEGPQIMVVSLQDGQPKVWGCAFGTSGLEFLLRMAGHSGGRIVADEQILKRRTHADVLFDASSSQQQRNRDLARQMLEHFSIRLEEVTEVRPAIVLRGRFGEIRGPVDHHEAPRIILSLAEQRFGNAGGTVHSTRQFADLLESHVGLPVEIEGVPEHAEPIRVAIHQSTYRTERIEELFAVIENQCDLRLSLEDREVTMLHVTEAAG